MLAHSQVRNAKAAGTPRKIFDARGLYLPVMPTGGRYWRFNYRFNGRHKTLALGVYPDVPLARARERHQKARQLLAEGVDPAAVKQAVSTDFETVARAWYDRWKFGRNERRGALDIVRRVLQTCGQIMRYAVVNGLVAHNPVSDVNPHKPMSNNTLLFALYRMGYRGCMTGHGFRGVASTIAHEQGWPHEHIELQFAHQERNAVSAASAGFVLRAVVGAWSRLRHCWPMRCCPSGRCGSGFCARSTVRFPPSS